MLPLWKFFLEKRQFTILIIVGLTIWGTFAAFQITKESTPEVQIPVGAVIVVLPGASPEDVERLITNKIEDQLANLQDLNTLGSVSREGISTVIAEFNANADIPKSIQKLKDEVDKVVPELPSEANTPVVSELNFVDQPIQLISVSADLPPAQFAQLAEDLRAELQTVQGVSGVDISGVRDREIQVVVRKEEIARLGISLPQVVAAIGSANASLPVGSITVDDINYAIAFRGSLDNVQDIGSIAILNVSGRVVYLRDIATVTDGVKEATSYSRVSLEGQPSRQAMTLGIKKIRGFDITTVTDEVEEKLAEMQNGGLLAGSDVVITYDAGDEVKKNLFELTETGLITVVLVMLSLFATIGWRESVVAGLSIPLSFVIALVGLLYSGNTLNVVSLFSLILAIGILVDSGIVIVEAIHTRTRLYNDPMKASIEALKDYAWPLIGGTVATIAFFVPLFFISGIVGKFIASIPFTLIFVLTASIFVALGLVPTLANMFAVKEESTLAHKQDEYAERARKWYADKLRTFLKNRQGQNRFLTVMVIAFILALALPIGGLMRVEFFPADDIDFLYVDIEAPQGTDLNRTDLIAREVEEYLYGDPRFESLITTVGATSPFSSTDGSSSNDPRFASITVNLTEDRSESSQEILEEVKERLKPIRSAEIRAGSPSNGPPVGSPVLIKFLGSDREAIDQAIARGRRILEQTPGATAVNSSNKYDGTQYVLSIDRGKLASLGLSPASVAMVLRTAVSGSTATSLTGGEKDVDIVVSLNLNPSATDPHDSSRTTIDSLRQVPIQTPNGKTVLLGSLITESVAKIDTSIVHENRERAATLTSDVLPGYTVLDVLNAFNDEFEKEPLPPGVRLEIGGENEETNQSFAEMGFSLIAGCILTFVILVLSFNSFRFAGFLLLLVPLSLIGVFVGLTLTFQPLSFPSVMGVIALAGVIINHAIILVDAILQRLKHGEGKHFSDIIIDAAVSRLRPIVLTTITTVIGMVPLVFASSLFGPLALAILFGLSFAMILTLVFIPTLAYRWPGKTLPEGVIRD